MLNKHTPYDDIMWRTTQAVAARDRVVKNGGVDVFPGVRSDDPAYLKMTLDMAKTAEDVLPPSDTSEGFVTGDAIPGNFRALLTVAGYKMDPMGYPLLDNRPLTPSTYTSQRHREIYQKLGDLLYEKWEPEAFVIARDSSSTFPFFSKDMQIKRAHLRETGRNIDKIASLIESDNLDDLLRDHSVQMAYYVARRAQADKVEQDQNGELHSKPREAWSFETAMSRARPEVAEYADKTIDGVKDHFAQRMRIVYGMSGSVNYYLTAVMAGFRNYLKRYSFTFKHTGQRDLEEKIGSNMAIGVDTHQFDQHVPSFMIDHWLDLMSERVSPQVSTLLRHTMRAPMYVPSPNVGDKTGATWMCDDPLSVSSFDSHVGLPSGIAPNPDIGKWAATGAALCALDDIYGDVLERMDEVLKGAHPAYAVLDMSDDMLLLVKDSDVKRAITEKLQSGQFSPYFQMEQEEPVSFLGSVVRKTSSGLQAVPSVQSFLVNWCVPERPIGHPMRKLWAVGWYERNKHYRDAPAFEVAYDLLRKKAQHHLGIDIRTDFEREYNRQLRSLSADLSYEDQLFLEKPERIFYQLSVDDVNPALLNEMSWTVDAAQAYDLTANHIAQAVGGNYIH